MYKAVIFDFDGVIANTMRQNYVAWVYALNKFNFTLDEKQYYLKEGAPPIEIASSYTEDKNVIEQIISNKDKYFLSKYELRIYNGVVMLLNKVKKNKKLALVTGGSKSRVTFILKKMHLLSYFDVIITANDVTKGKPNGEPYIKALTLLNVPSTDCVVVENAPYGIKSARAANIYCIALETTLDKKYLYEADLILKNFEELIYSDIL